jgi:hypothetical protein
MDSLGKLRHEHPLVFRDPERARSLAPGANRASVE